MTIWFLNRNPLDPGFRWEVNFWQWHQPVTTKAELSSLYLSERRLWLRIRDFQSTKRKLSSDSLQVIHMYLEWITSTTIVKGLFPRQLWQGSCAADACAYSNICQIGRFVRFPNGATIWFSSRFDHTGFTSLRFISRSLQRCRNLLRVSKHWRKWLDFWFSVVTARVFDFHFGYLRLLIIVARNLVVSSYFPRLFPWICSWRSSPYYAPYQVWNWIYLSLQAIVTMKQALWADGTLSPLLHSDMIFAIEWIYRYRIFGYHVATFRFIVQIHICSGNLRSSFFSVPPTFLFDCWNPTLLLGYVMAIVSQQSDSL